LRLEYVNRFQPQDGVEMDLVDDMVNARWRLRRIAIMQTAALDLQMDKDEKELSHSFKQIDQPTRLVVAFGKLSNEGNTLQTLLRYETTYSRMYDRAMKALENLQAKREKPEEPETYEELQNDATPAESAPVSIPEVTSELSEMIVKMSKEELTTNSRPLKERCEASDPSPERVE